MRVLLIDYQRLTARHRFRFAEALATKKVKSEFLDEWVSAFFAELNRVCSFFAFSNLCHVFQLFAAEFHNLAHSQPSISEPVLPVNPLTADTSLYSD